MSKKKGAAKEYEKAVVESVYIVGGNKYNDGKIFRLLNKCFISFIISLVKMNIKKGKQLMPDGHFKADALSHFHIALLCYRRTSVCSIIMLSSSILLLINPSLFMTLTRG